MSKLEYPEFMEKDLIRLLGKTPDEERYNAIGHVQYIMSELEGD